MSGTEETWLKELTEQSMKKQERFMNHIASRLKRPRQISAPAQPFRGSPGFWYEMEWDERERIEKFTNHFESVGGHVVQVTSYTEAGQFIADKAEKLGAKRIIRQDQPELNSLGLEDKQPALNISTWNSEDDVNWKAVAAEADFGIVIADGAAAYTGSILVKSAREKGRSVTLLPTVMFIIIPVDRLKTRLGELLTPLDELGRERLPAGVHFISGPSRSSDIENELTIGVHGPGIVYAFLLG
ncbi:lactate utilization protein C [Paenibacillus provencensis]|uniref:Lactate utilization protein C n=1 Tax=Paenibacillus provencensis TaxID=441151 RepID=A0ABW3PVB3_9BACL|nr:LUD domain-containing protein [Paenibacillus sp. MER 78]MCM3128934.1 LUD domain-containing protein [Paenibacillus sp. MER 78]